MGSIVFDQDIALYYKYGSLLLQGKPVAAEYPELAVVFLGIRRVYLRVANDFQIRLSNSYASIWLPYCLLVA